MRDKFDAAAIAGGTHPDCAKCEVDAAASVITGRLHVRVDARIPRDARLPTQNAGNPTASAGVACGAGWCMPPSSTSVRRLGRLSFCVPVARS